MWIWERCFILSFFTCHVDTSASDAAGSNESNGGINGLGLSMACFGGILKSLHFMLSPSILSGLPGQAWRGSGMVLGCNVHGHTFNWDGVQTAVAKISGTVPIRQLFNFYIQYLRVYK